MKHTHTQPAARCRAYTLVEMLIVIAILGLVSAVVVPSMLTAGTMGVQAATRVIVSDLIFATNDAMAQQTSRQVIFDVTNNTFRIADNTGTTITAPWQGGASNNYIREFDSDARFAGVTLLSASFGGDGTIVFSDLGAPDTGGSIELEYNEHRYRITVAEFTGRITVDKITGGG